MKGAPYFKFYPSDFIGGTSDMTQEEVGAYIRLLCAQWQLGGLPSDPARLFGVAGGIVPPMVLDKLPIDKTDGKRRNLRLELTRQEVTSKIEKLRDNGSKGGKATAAANAVANAAPIAVANAQANGVANGVACQMSDVRSHIPEATDQKPETNTGAIASQVACVSPPFVKKRRKKDPSQIPAYTPEFLDGYGFWPKKVNKAESFELFTAVTRTIEPAKLVDCIKAAVIRMGRDWTKEGAQYCPAMNVWLNRRGWHDVLDASGNVAFPTTTDGAQDEFADTF
jgi:hypothetical protein